MWARNFQKEVNSMDYTEQFNAVSEQLSELQTGVNEIITVAADLEGIFIFFSVALLCFLVYKFFRIFF